MIMKQLFFIFFNNFFLQFFLNCLYNFISLLLSFSKIHTTRLTARTGISRPGTVPSRRGTGMGPNLCGMGAPGPGLAWDRDGMGRGLGGMGWDRDPGLSRPACYQTALPMLNSSLYSSQ